MTPPQLAGVSGRLVSSGPAQARVRRARPPLRQALLRALLPCLVFPACGLQELPLLEAQLGERPDLADAAAACEAAGAASSSRRAAAQPDLKHQVGLSGRGT